MANDPTTLDYQLNHIGTSSDEKVRAAVARNPNVQHRFLLENFADDTSSFVRRAAAENPRKMTERLWHKLAKDEDPSVVEALKRVWPEPPTELLQGNGMTGEAYGMKPRKRGDGA